MNGGEGLHFFEHVEFDGFPAPFIHAGQAIGAQANVYAGAEQFAQGKGIMPEIDVTSGTMDYAHFSFGQQGGILLAEVVDMHRQQVFPQHPLPLQVLDRRAQAAV